MATLQNTTRFVLLCCTLCLLCTITAESQSSYFPPPPAMPPPSQQGILPPPAPPCINCYKGFAFPTSFSFGAHYNVHGLNTRGWATDSLRFDFIQFYRGPSSLIYYRDTTRWTYVSDYGNVGMVNGRWSDSLNRIFYNNAEAAGLGVVYAAGYIGSITTGSEGAEDYYTAPYNTPWGQVFDYRYLPNIDARTAIDTMLHCGAFGGRFSSGTGGSIQIAGDPVYTSEGLIRAMERGISLSVSRLML